MSSIIKRMVLAIKVSTYCHGEAGKVLTIMRDFNIDLNDGSTVRAKTGQNIFLGRDHLNIGNMVFGKNKDGGLGTSTLKLFQNGHASKFNKIDWNNIDEIYG